MEALARTTSLSVIVPISLRMILILMPLTSIFCKEFFKASSLPLTSVFKITLISLVPSSIAWNKESKEIFSFLNFWSRAIDLRFSATSLAWVSDSKLINLSPASGFPWRPVISTGVEGPALTTSWPKSFFIVLTLP